MLPLLLHTYNLQAPLKRCILKAKCGIIDGWDARLECYKDVKSANIEGPIMWRMFFTDVEEVHYIERRQKAAVIIMHMKKGNKIIFSADSDPSTKNLSGIIFLHYFTKYHCMLYQKCPKKMSRFNKESFNCSLMTEV